MQRSHSSLLVFLAIVFCCGSSRAELREAPQFTLRTLDGRTYNNASLSGSYTLLQFWATWCPHCRSDESALDEVERRYGSQGLVVLAIDEGESAENVQTYLREHPRSVPIVLDEDNRIAGRFGKHGLPYYVLIDKRGNIVGTQNGAGGKEALLSLVGHKAGFPGAPSEPASGTAIPTEDRRSAGMKVIEVPHENRVAISKPLPKTVFVLKSGERLESDHYTLDAHDLRIASDGQNRTIPTGSLDVSATQAANRARGVDLKVPTGRNEFFLAF